MRLLKFNEANDLCLTDELHDNIPPYAILSHTWGSESDEVTFDDIETGKGVKKLGYDKIKFCGERANQDGIDHFWVDTCCIDNRNHVQLTEAITSMYHWYRRAVKCYVYLCDVQAPQLGPGSVANQPQWELSYRNSKWFTRGWTLQELLAPKVVEFFSCDQQLLGDRDSLKHMIHEITTIPIAAIEGVPLADFSVTERFRWAVMRQTKRVEDKAYCLQGMLGVYIPPMYGEGDHASLRLREEIEKRSAALAKSINKNWLGLRPTNPNFTGRDDLIQELCSAIRNKLNFSWLHPQYRLVISGISGVGKSELCLQLAQRLRHLFRAVIWVDARTTVKAEKSLLSIAQKLGKPASKLQDACQAVSDLQHPWLLFLDGADETNINYQEYIPKGDLGVVIVTRCDSNHRLSDVSKLVNLIGLDDHEARRLVRKMRAINSVAEDQTGSEADAVTQLVKLLHGHPVALCQAAGHIARRYCSVNDYPRAHQHYKNQSAQEYADLIHSQQHGDVYTTLAMSVDALDTDSSQAAQDALKLLTILTMFGSEQIPFHLFEEGKRCARTALVGPVEHTRVCCTPDSLTSVHARHAPAFMEMDSEDSSLHRFHAALDLLTSLSLAVVEQGDDSDFEYMSVHPFIRTWLSRRLPPRSRFDAWLQTGTILGFARQGHCLPHAQLHSLSPHVEAFLEPAATYLASETDPDLSESAIQVLIYCAWMMTDMAVHNKVATCVEAIYNHLQLDRTQVDPKWVSLYILAGSNLKRVGNSSEAVLYQERVKDFQDRNFSHNHPQRLASLCDLAVTYRTLGRKEEALKLLEEVVSMRARLTSNRSPFWLFVRHELATTYKANNQVEKAIEVFEEVVEAREQVLSQENSDLLTSQYELASAYRANDQARKAIPIFEKVVQVRVRMLGKQHWKLLNAQLQLGNAYRMTGQVSKARSLLEAVVQVYVETTDRENAQRLTSQHDLALVYLSLRKTRKAVPLLEEVVEIRQRILGDEHTQTLLSQHELARAYNALGETSRSIKIIERVVEIRTRTTAEDSKARLTSMNNLAFYLWETQRSTRSAELMSEVVRHYKKLYPAGHKALNSAIIKLEQYQAVPQQSDTSLTDQSVETDGSEKAQESD